MAREIILICFFILSLGHFHAQFGCTDPQANNFNAQATVNDGSCQYNVTTENPLLIANLSNRLLENSGMIVWNNHIWMLNDGGSQPILFQLDFSGVILDSFCVSNATNVDWEALSQSSTHLFIGDFGNNAGNRTDLCFYQINKSDLIGNQTHTVLADKKMFKYADQTSFSGPTNGHAFDAEAFYVEQDSLVILTKNWSNFYSKRYRFPCTWQDTISISPLDSMFLDGLITDVTFNEATNRIVALGYKNNGSNFYTSFAYLFFDYPESSIFNGNVRRIELGNMLTLSQTEGISWIDSVNLFMSSEKITSIITIPPKLFTVDVSTYFMNQSGLIEMNDVIQIFPNPVKCWIDVPIDWDAKVCKIVSMNGQEYYCGVVHENDQLDLGKIPFGVYTLQIGNSKARLVITE